MPKHTLYCIGNRFQSFWPFADLFKISRVVNTVEDIKKTFSDGDVILFEGGEDISPALYEEELLAVTHAAPYPSLRDRQELRIFDTFKDKAKFLGICRGAQLLCALSGGKLVQHVSNHAGVGHEIDTDKGETYFVSSAHHQMQWPWETDHKLLAWSSKPQSNVYTGVVRDTPIFFPDNAYKKGSDLLLEPEVVYYPKTKSLAIQYHPEFMKESDLGVHYAARLVEEYLL